MFEHVQKIVNSLFVSLNVVLYVLLPVDAAVGEVEIGHHFGGRPFLQYFLVRASVCWCDFDIFLDDLLEFNGALDGCL